MTIRYIFIFLLIGLIGNTALAQSCVSTAPTATSPLSYCQNAVAVPLTATGTALKWYTAETGGAGSTTAPTPTTTTAGTTSYWVTQTLAGCGESERVQIDVVTNALPTAPVAAATVNYCQNATATALTATGLTGATLNWYTVATGGAALGAAPTLSTTAVGNTSYWVSQTVGGCEGSRSQITVTVNALPALPTIAVTQNCGGTKIMTRNNVTGLSYQWFNSATIIAGATGLTQSSTTTGSFTVRATNSLGCSATSVADVTAVSAATCLGNDNCTGAITLIPNTTLTPTSGTTFGATNAGPALTGCVGTANHDVWYSFVAPAASVGITVGGPSDYVHQVFSGTCAGLTSLVCSDPNTSTVSGLTIGQTYFIRVYLYFGTTPTAATGAHTIGITFTPPVPGCNLGSGVTNLASLPYTGTALTNCGGGNDQTAANTLACGSTFYLGGEDNMYVFTPTVSGFSTINVTATAIVTPATAASTYVGLMLYQGCPLSNSTAVGTCVTSSNSSSGTQTLSNVSLVAGQTYYLLVDSYPTPNCHPSFTLTIPAPAPAVALACVAAPTVPTNAATGIVNNTPLRWPAVAGATSYDVYLGSSPTALNLYGNFISAEVSATVITGAAVPFLNSNTTYYWQVVPRNASGVPTGCSTFSFTTAASPTNVVNTIEVNACWSPPGGTTANVPVSSATLITSAGTAPVGGVVTAVVNSLSNDDSGVIVTSPFPFNFNNINYNSYFVSSNGNIQFSTSSSTQYINAAPGTTGLPDFMLAAFWDDLRVDCTAPNSSSVTMDVYGTTPNRYTVISWNNVHRFSTSCGNNIDFQIVLQEGANGRVQYNYLPNYNQYTDAGTTPPIYNATIGAEVTTANVAIASGITNNFPFGGASYYFNVGGGAIPLAGAPTGSSICNCSIVATTPTNTDPAPGCSGISSTITGTGSINFTGNYSFWDSPRGGNQFTNLNGYVVSGSALTTPATLAAGSYDYYIQADNSPATCSSIRKKVTLLVNQTPAAPTAVTPVSLCQNSVASPLSASVVGAGTSPTSAAATFNWYTTATGGTALAGAPTPPTTTLGLPAISYWVSQTTNTCESPRTKIDVNVIALPTLTLSKVDACATTGSISFTTVAGLMYGFSAGPTYTGTSLSAGCIASNTVAGVNTISNLAPAAYTVRLYNPITGCFTDATVTINNTRPVAPTFTVVANDGCGGLGSIALASGSSVRYYTDAALTTPAGGSTTVPTFPTAPNGKQVVAYAVATSGACVSVTTPVIAVVTPNNGVTVNAGPDITACADCGSVLLSGASVTGVPTAVPNRTGTWSIVPSGTAYTGAGALSSTSATTTPNTVTYTPVAADAGKVVRLRLTSHDPEGPCPTKFDEMDISINQTVALIATPLDITCTDPTRVLDASTSTNTGGTKTYLWAAGSGGIIDSGGSTAMPTVSAGGVYTVTVTAGGCSSTKTITVTETKAPPTVTTTSITNVCPATTTSLVTAITSSTTGLTLAYYSDAGLTTAVADPTMAATGATYYVLATNTTTGCTASAAIMTTITACCTNPTFSAPVIVDVTCSAMGSINLTQTGGTTTGLTYAWTGTAQVTEDITGLTAGTYTVTVTTTGGCSATVSATVDSNITPPTVTTGSDFTTVTCTNETATLTPNGAGFVWSGGTNVVMPTATTTYTVTATAANGCTASATIEILFNKTPPTVTSIVTNASCTAIADGAIDITAGGVPTLSYIWNNSATTQDLANILSGTYTVTVRAGNGCSSTKVVTVNDTYTAAAVPAGVTVPTGGAFPACFAAASNGGAAVSETFDNFCTPNLTTPVGLTTPNTGNGIIKGNGYNSVQTNTCGIVFNHPVAYTIDCARSGNLDVTVTPQATPAPTGTITQLNAAIYGPFSAACPTINFATDMAIDCQQQTNFSTPALLQVTGATAGQVYIVVVDTDNGRGAVAISAPMGGGSALPVDLLSFTGKINNTENDIHWESASEKNVAFFAVERSTDGINFKEVNRTSATNRTHFMAYDWADKAPAARSYYRLRMVDYDGSYRFAPNSRRAVCKTDAPRRR